MYNTSLITMITMTNKSVMTFISVNKISGCLSVYDVMNEQDSRHLE